MSTESPTPSPPSTGGTFLAGLLGLAVAVGFVLGSRSSNRRQRRGRHPLTHRSQRLAGQGSAGARNLAAAIEHRASKKSGGVAAVSVDALKKARRKAKKIKKRLT